MVSEGLLTSSQEPVTGSYPKPDETCPPQVRTQFAILLTYISLGHA